MKRFLLYFLSCSLIFTISFNRNSHAVPAYPHPIEFKQPDGTLITIQLKGDEKVNWAETLDGYTILVTKEGEYQYAVHNSDGDLVFSGIAVSPIDYRSKSEEDFIKTLEKGLFFSADQVKMLKQVWELKENKAAKSFPTTGEQTVLCLLMQTPDRQFVKTQAEFDALFNQMNYTVDGATGSFREFYLENSYGLLDVTVDVFGPYTAEHNMSHYAADARLLVAEGVHLADDDVNYADYDVTGNGYVDGLYMIFAGYGQEAGGGPNTIWSHAWAVWPAIELDGTLIFRYACSPELRGNSGSNITRIGVVAHEFGHTLGAPDFYDTDGNTGGAFAGTGNWDLMASGTWNNGGATPAHHNGFTKVYFYNWASATIINSPDHLVLNNAAEYDDSFYRINTTTTNEYFLLENREKHLFDAHIPGSGMIIYHVHPDVMNASNSNSVNQTHPQKMYPVAANATSDPNSNPASYGNINHSSAAWTGLGGKTEFTDTSVPSSQSWAGNNTEKPITNISRNLVNKTVSFDFMGGSLPVYTITFNVTDEEDNPIPDAAISLNQQSKLLLPPVHLNGIQPQNHSDIDLNDHLNSIASVESSGTAAPSKQNAEEGIWIHYDTGVNASSVGLGSGGLFDVAVRWEPEDLEEFEGMEISKLRFYINHLPLAIRAKVWQGTSAESLMLLADEPVDEFQEESWVEFTFPEPISIETSLELWVGYQVNDPGAGLFPAGVDDQSEPDGFGNLLSMGGSWVKLSDYGINGMWNLQAFLTPEEEIFYYTDENGQFSIELPSAEYDYVVNKVGYLPAEGSFEVIEEDIVIEVTLFEDQPYLLTVVADPVEGGTVSGGGEYFPGETVLLTAVPEEDFYFVNWTDEEDNVVSEEASFDFTMPSKEVTLTANFGEIVFFTLTYLAGENGSLEGETTQTVQITLDGTPVTAVPDDNYYFVQWSDGNTDNPRIDQNVTEDITVTAEFAIYTYTLTYLADTGGSLEGETDQTVDHGQDGTPVTAVPDANYHFSQWSDGIADNPRTDENVTEDIEVTAEFALNTYTLTTEVNGEGNVHVAGQPYTAPLTLEFGTEVNLDALAADGWQFDNWTGDVTSDQATVTVTIEGDVSVTASFSEIPMYILTLASDPENSASFTGGGSYHSGTMVEITATPHEGYIFSYWKDPFGNTLSNNGTFQYSMPADDITLTAVMIVDNVSVDDAYMQGFKVYPNPASQSVSIQSPHEISRVRIINLSGQIVLSLPVSSPEVSVDISSLYSGLYIVEVITAEQLIRKKLQVE